MYLQLFSGDLIFFPPDRGSNTTRIGLERAWAWASKNSSVTTNFGTGTNANLNIEQTTVIIWEGSKKESREAQNRLTFSRLSA